MAGNPSLEECEGRLRRIMSVDQVGRGALLGGTLLGGALLGELEGEGGGGGLSGCVPNRRPSSLCLSPTHGDGLRCSAAAKQLASVAFPRGMRATCSPLVGCRSFTPAASIPGHSCG
jgi:hypothetical protein